MSTWWISEQLLTRTIDVWSRACGREVSEGEAIEMLMNVKRLGEYIIETRRTIRQRRSRREGGETE
jgi:hypothetical protein